MCVAWLSSVHVCGMLFVTGPSVATGNRAQQDDEATDVADDACGRNQRSVDSSLDECGDIFDRIRNSWIFSVRLFGPTC